MLLRLVENFIDGRLAIVTGLGRMIQTRHDSTLRLADLLDESLTARKPLFVSPTSVELERSRMEMEDLKGHIER